MSKISSVNEFVIKFANVNGSGSASANQMFAKAIFRSGIPVSPKNIFPSNIQGLPTWFKIRASAKGYLGRKAGIDFMVAMNPQSYQQDVAEINSNGYLLYDSSWKREFHREDINILEVPLTSLVVDTFPNPKTRLLFKNMVYVGALSYLMNINKQVFIKLIEEQFKGKEKLISPNIQALEIGFNYAEKNLKDACSIKVQDANLTDGMILTNGNNAGGLGCVYGGATVCAWYPITPSTSLAESYKKYCDQFRVDDKTGKNKFAFVQAEDELSSIGMAIGANWNGARAFTATSGPGISLMNEFIGLAYFAEVPVVIFDIQRTGPSTGMPTRTQQSDLISCAYASHGDTKHVLLFPADPHECFTMAPQAFDLADRLQTPVMVLSDLDIGMNDWMVPEFEWDESYVHDRGKVLSAEDLEEMDAFYRYLDVDGDGITYRTLPGTHPKGSFFTRGSGHTKYGAYTENAADYQEVIDRLSLKWETARKLVPEPEVAYSKFNNAAILTVGSGNGACREALDKLGNQNIGLNYCRVKAFPFSKSVREFIDKHEVVYVVEQNRDAQLRALLILELNLRPDKLVQ